MIQWTVVFGAFAVGTCFSLLGSISIKLMPRLGIDTGRFGSLVSAVMLAAAASAILVGLGIDRWGYKPFAVCGFVVTGAAIFTIARSTSFTTVFVACLVLGAGAMGLSNFSTTLMPVVLFDGQSPAAAINLGNVAFGMGLFLTPFITSFLFQRVRFETAVSVLAAMVTLPALLATFVPDFPRAATGFSPAAAGLLVQPVIIVAGLTLFCYISIESSFSSWIVPYAKQVIWQAYPGREEADVDATSQRILSLFAVAMMAGRVLISRTAAIETHGAWIVALLAAVSAGVIHAMTRCGARWTAWLVVGGGLAFSAIFPTVLAEIYRRHPDGFSTVFGFIFAVGLLGAVIVPKAIGNLARGRSVQRSLRLLLPICGVMVVLALLLRFV